ncbi:MAG: glycosyl hydrolase [Candidatus Omnitrophota bacterium]
MKRIVLLLILLVLAERALSATIVSTIDNKATAETKKLFVNLKELMGSKTLFGQAHFYTRTCSGNAVRGTYPVDAYKITGKYPFILSADYKWDKDDVVYHYNKGGAILMAWGMYNPVNVVVGTDGKDYVCVKEHISNAELNRPITGTDVWSYWQSAGTRGYGDAWKDNHLYDQDDHPIRKILTGGLRNAYYHALLDQVAAYFNELKDSKGKLIPVIFRPFHECDGEWFWWGRQKVDSIQVNTDAEYIQLWQETVKYLKDVKGVHNILWCFNYDTRLSDTAANFVKRYPGNDYVDVIALDCYGSDNLLLKTQTIVKEAENRGKVAGIAEFSRDAQKGIDDKKNYWMNEFWDVIKSDSTASKIVFACSYSNGPKVYYGPGWRHEDAPSFKAFISDEKVVMLGDIEIR